MSNSFETPWTVARYAPLSIGFSRQEYCSGLPFPSPGDLPNPGIEPGSPALQADALPSEPPGKPVMQLVLNSLLESAFALLCPVIKTLMEYSLRDNFFSSNLHNWDSDPLGLYFYIQPFQWTVFCCHVVLPAQQILMV